MKWTFSNNRSTFPPICPFTIFSQTSIKTIMPLPKLMGFFYEAITQINMMPMGWVLIIWWLFKGKGKDWNICWRSVLITLGFSISKCHPSRKVAICCTSVSCSRTFISQECYSISVCLSRSVMQAEPVFPIWPTRTYNSSSSSANSTGNVLT